jgi:hypothetical protein
MPYLLLERLPDGNIVILRKIAISLTDQRVKREIDSSRRLSCSSVKLLNITFMSANAVGIVLYLLLASRGWRILQEHGMVPVTGEPFVWALAIPVLAAFLLANIVWAVLLVRYRESKRGPWWLITGGVWLLTICADFAHH